MMQKIVILGNHFICDKRICNLVQKTITMEDVEVENYLHLHKFFKDQRAITVDASVPVNTGYIFTGEAFVNPITLQSYSIDGEIDEEELDTSAPDNSDEAFVKRIVEKIIQPVVDRLNENRNEPHGPYYTEYSKPKRYRVMCGSLVIRSGPTIYFPTIGYEYKDSVVIIYGIDSVNKYGYMGNGNWISADPKYLQEIK